MRDKCKLQIFQTIFNKPLKILIRILPWLTPLSKRHECGVRCAHWGVGWHKNSHNTQLEEVSELQAALFSELLTFRVSPLPGDLLLDLSAIFKVHSYNIVDNFPSSLRQGHFLRDSERQSNADSSFMIFWILTDPPSNKKRLDRCIMGVHPTFQQTLQEDT